MQNMRLGCVYQHEKYYPIIMCNWMVILQLLFNIGRAPTACAHSARPINKQPIRVRYPGFDQYLHKTSIQIFYPIIMCDWMVILQLLFNVQKICYKVD